MNLGLKLKVIGASESLMYVRIFGVSAHNVSSDFLGVRWAWDFTFLQSSTWCHYDWSSVNHVLSRKDIKMKVQLHNQSH